MLHGHGDEIMERNALIANFSTNIPPNIGSEQLHSHLSASMAGVGNYPDADATFLATKLAPFVDVSVTSLLVTNGATEAFYLIASMYARKRSLIFSPSFSEYEDACHLYQHQLTFAAYGDMAETELAGYDVVWLCNPNNPDGRVLDMALIKQWLIAFPSTLFVLDEAYIDLLPDVPSLLCETDSYKNLVVVRSMTKRYGIPGLRLGYMVTCCDRVAKIKEQLMPWRINSLAIEAGLFIANGLYTSPFDVHQLHADSRWLQQEIDKIEGFSVLPSDANFFLVETLKPAIELKKWLFNTYGFLIRDAANFRGLSSNWFRISVQTEKHNKRLINYLKEWHLISK